MWIGHEKNARWRGWFSLWWCASADQFLIQPLQGPADSSEAFSDLPELNRLGLCGRCLRFRAVPLILDGIVELDFQLVDLGFIGLRLVARTRQSQAIHSPSLSLFS